MMRGVGFEPTKHSAEQSLQPSWFKLPFFLWHVVHLEILVLPTSYGNVVDWSFLTVLLLSLKVERSYVSSPAIVANTVSIFVSTVHHWDSVPVCVQDVLWEALFLRIRSNSAILRMHRVGWATIELRSYYSTRSFLWLFSCSFSVSKKTALAKPRSGNVWGC